jgi:hypothetical protein
MEAGLTEVCKDIRVGKILIQTSPESGEPGTYLAMHGIHELPYYHTTFYLVRTEMPYHEFSTFLARISI